MTHSAVTVAGDVPASEAGAFASLLASGCPVLIDGGLATQCEAQGCNIDGDLWSAALLQSDPGAIVAAHRAYLDAGAKLVGGCCRIGPSHIAAMARSDAFAR